MGEARLRCEYGGLVSGCLIGKVDFSVIPETGHTAVAVIFFNVRKGNIHIDMAGLFGNERGRSVQKIARNKHKTHFMLSD